MCKKDQKSPQGLEEFHRERLSKAPVAREGLRLVYDLKDGQSHTSRNRWYFRWVGTGVGAPFRKGRYWGTNSQACPVADATKEWVRRSEKETECQNEKFKDYSTSKIKSSEIFNDENSIIKEVI